MSNFGFFHFRTNTVNKFIPEHPTTRPEWFDWCFHDLTWPLNFELELWPMTSDLWPTICEGFLQKTGSSELGWHLGRQAKVSPRPSYFKCSGQAKTWNLPEINPSTCWWSFRALRPVVFEIWAFYEPQVTLMLKKSEILEKFWLWEAISWQPSDLKSWNLQEIWPCYTIFGVPRIVRFAL